MIEPLLSLESALMATPRPLVEVGRMFGKSRATMFRLARDLDLTKYRMPGGGKGVYLDPDEVRRKLRPQPRPAVESSPRPSAKPTPQPARTDDGRPILSGAIIPHPDGRAALLMSLHVWHAESAWSWIGGHVRPGEDPAAAVLREIGEELDAEGVRVVRLLGVVDTHIDASRWWGPRYEHGYVGYHYLVAIESPDVRVVDHEELTRVEWLTLDQVAEAVAGQPEELREADMRFAREAVGLLAGAE